MKYFLQLTYKGTNYHGWQRQPNLPSIQEELESAITKMIGEKINCIGCGRTDAGVHASQYFCHIKIEEELDFDPVFRLNKMLPEDIVIKSFNEVSPEVHAQHSATLRTYTYFIHHFKNPYINEVSSFYPDNNLVFEQLVQAINLIKMQNNYLSFCRTPNIYKSTICDMKDAKVWQNSDKTQMAMQFTANRFLRGMVRILVANILEVGYGRMSLKEFENCFKNSVPPKYFKEAYPQGLHLTKVEYPFIQNNHQSFNIGNISSDSEVG